MVGRATTTTRHLSDTMTCLFGINTYSSLDSRISTVNQDGFFHLFMALWIKQVSQHQLPNVLIHSFTDFGKTKKYRCLVEMLSLR